VNPTLVLLLEILQIASASAGAVVTGDAAKATELSGSLLAIIQKGVAAYEAQEGKPIDPTLIKAFEPV
jgi:hypothetical protein